MVRQATYIGIGGAGRGLLPFDYLGFTHFIDRTRKGHLGFRPNRRHLEYYPALTTPRFYG